LIVINSCKSNDYKETVPGQEILFDKFSNDTVRSINFEIAYDNNSTAPNYVVFKAKDLNTGLIKEICTEAPFLSGALHIEFGVDYDKKGIKYIDSIARRDNQTIFEFRKKEALDNIDFFNYPEYHRILEIAKGLDLEYYHRKFGKNDVQEKKYFPSDSGFVQLTFCHIMFKCGILTRRDCIAGNNIYFGFPPDY
jgi:hypothetical protein